MQKVKRCPDHSWHEESNSEGRDNHKTSVLEIVAECCHHPISSEVAPKRNTALSMAYSLKFPFSRNYLRCFPLP
jgi:hypothetical protein